MCESEEVCETQTDRQKAASLDLTSFIHSLTPPPQIVLKYLYVGDCAPSGGPCHQIALDPSLAPVLPDGDPELRTAPL